MTRSLAGGAGIQTVPITDCAVTPAGEVITGVLAHHARMAAARERPPGEEPPPGLRYRPESLEALFGRPRHDHP